MFNFKSLLLFLLMAPLWSFAAAEDEAQSQPRIYTTGCLKSDYDAPIALKAYDLKSHSGAIERLPQSHSLEHLFKNLPVYDQGNLGACTGHAVANALWALMTNLEMEPFSVSRLYVYHKTLKRTCRGNLEDIGASLADTTTTLMQDGFCHENLWPYDNILKKFKQDPSPEADADASQHKLLGDLSVAWIGPNINNMKLALKNGFVLPIGMEIFESFPQVGADGRVPLPRHGEQSLGGHAMAIIGYNDVRQAFRVLNSWGEEWGDKGHAWIPYDLIKRKVSEVWAYRRITGAPEAEILLDGIYFEPSTSTIPQDDSDVEDLSKQLSKSEL